MRVRRVKVYRVYKYGSVDAVKLGGKVWTVYKLYRSKYRARRALEYVKWVIGRRGVPRARMRVVLTNLGWAVVSQSPYPQFQHSARVLKVPR